MKNKIHSVLFGLAVGDALGVPVEFQNRELLKRFPVIDMRENGSHRQLKGTWSDDSSLAFCLADSLCNGYNIEDIATKFLQWKNAEIWTPHGSVFDIGIATRNAIYRIAQGEQPTLCGGFDEEDNGNGSLMRILPIAFYLKDEADLNLIYQTVKDVSSITHAHFRSVFACFIYIIYTLELLKIENKFDAYQKTKTIVNNFIVDKEFNEREIQLFDRILKSNINEFDKDKINSSGYVLHSLEASFWCILNSSTYKETVLKAVNLGEDTDTTAAIAGGLAGLIYGYDEIPVEWINVLARRKDITELCDKLDKKTLNLN
ncbi:ADP-ribosylglycohydrolase family protein [Flavobacterium sp.]|uniref:ADP-ribosylglycohydrolase family protein n=1 Tax=Flavobacterium sp. TaxID=239 RepID=UPI00286BF8BF|nr:ADP-ribosylglycohydrolase family protein [Flavobacterium sp.]